jgi:hypothetical protein
VSLPGTIAAADPGFSRYSTASCGGTIWIG